MGRLFVNHGVNAVWNGHVHAFEHYSENGIDYIVMGTGGGPSGTLGEEKYEGYQNGLEHCLAYARVTVDPESDTATVAIVRGADYL
jgi:hypothetical protein